MSDTKRDDAVVDAAATAPEGDTPYFEAIPPCSIVLMGASGDLSKRMVVPAIFRLWRRGILPSGSRLIGYARDAWSTDHFREVMRDAVLASARPGDAEAWPEFAAAMSYVPEELVGDDERGYSWIADELGAHLIADVANGDAGVGVGGAEGSAPAGVSDGARVGPVDADQVVGDPHAPLRIEAQHQIDAVGGDDFHPLDSLP